MPPLKLAGLKGLMLSALLVLSACQSAAPVAPTPATTAPTSAPAPAAGGNTPAGALAALHTSAKTQGPVAEWGGESTNDQAEIFTAFSAQYPGVNVQITNINPDAIPTQFLTQKAAGSAPPDIVAERPEYNQPLRDANALAADPGWAALGAAPQIIRPDGGLAYQADVFVLAYNTQKIQANALPTTWDALADAKYKGLLSVDPRGFPFNYMAVGRGVEGAVSLAKAVKEKAQPLLVQGDTAGMTQLASGEIVIRPAALAVVKVQQAKGAPIGYVYLDQVPTQRSNLYLTSGARNPDAAKLWAVWVTSPAGQAFTLKQNQRSNLLPTDIPATSKLLDASSAADYASIAGATAEVVKVWAP